MDVYNDLPKNKYPLSYNQQSLWFIYKLSPDSGCYNINYTWEVTTEINLFALKDAIQLVTDRHPQLKNLIRDKDGVPFQEERKGTEIYFEIIDGESWKADELDQFIRRETLKPFNFREGCFFRWTVIQLAGVKKLLSVTGQHIASDLWSHIRFMNEVGCAYGQLAEGSDPTDHEQKECYADFIEQQQKYINTSAGEKAFGYWKKRLKGSKPVLDLPTDYMRSANPNFGCSSLKLSLTSSQAEKIKNLAYSHSSTPYALLLAVYYILLYRLTHQQDISIGTPVPGRNKRDFKDVVGYFVNTVVVRQKIDPEQSFLMFFKLLTDSLKATREHQDYPLSLLAEKLRPARNTNRHPFFSVMFSLEDPNSFLDQGKVLVSNSDKGEIWNLGTFSMRLVQKSIVDDFDLSLRVRVIENDYSITWAYNSGLFKPETIKRFAKHFNTLLDEILAEPTLPVNRIPILTESEYKTITVDWNDTGTAYPRHDSVVSIFETYARDFPDKVALDFERTQVLYQDLNTRSNQLAHFLISKGVASEQPVALSMHRSFEMIIAVLAIIKAGGVYVPIDPDYPQDRKQYILKDSASKMVLTQGTCASDFERSKLIVSRVDEDWKEFGRFSDQNPNLKIDADQLLYVLYTSGSTGNPKGVCVSHRNAIRLVKNTNYMHFGPEENLLMFAPLSFDLSTFEIWGALLNGSRLSIFDPHLPTLGELAQFIFDKKITTLWLTSGLYHQIAEAHLHKLVNVKQLVVGGDVVSVPHALKTIKALKHTQLINGYGPTENTTFTCCYGINDPAQIQYTVPIGRPVANTKVYIVDKNLNPVPIGVTGELCTSGDGLARGYLNKPEKTLEKFVENPFSEDKTEKLYKTGDLARYRPDGNIEFLGRTDFQVKIRGFRIEPGEIEACLSDFPGVKDVAVVAKEVTPGNKQLIAYLVPEQEKTLFSDEIRRFTSSQLPDHMIPSTFVTLSCLPLTRHGKLDRNQLPLPEPERPDLSVEYLGATSKEEEILVSIWKEVLNLENVGTRDNFFDLGGNSILMLQVHGKLPPGMRERITLLDLLEYPTIESLAVHTGRNGQTATNPPVARPSNRNSHSKDIAIISMVGRFPGADSVEELWQNLLGGVESITHFTEEELLAAKISKEDLIHPDYVKSKGVILAPELFDSHFFGFNPKLADLTDPQQRLFLECSWEALELAGYDPSRYPGKIGVYGGSGFNSYRYGLEENTSSLNSTGDFPTMIGNEKDFLCTRVAYKLNLKGPAVATQTACSSSLVAIHSACQSLKSLECDMALAGGVSVIGNTCEGYFYEKGGILSPDGHCRPFDALGQGTVPGQGVGLVVLKRLEDALQDGDTIHAIIKGTATNNDGSMKAGYTAPGVEGQVNVIREALHAAGVDPKTIRYIETHGTGTPLGDPIEIRALSKVYGANRPHTGDCALGAVKSNLGHLDAAAGVTGLIKAALTLKNKQLVPLANFKNPNPGIDFENSPFFITDRLKDFTSNGYPLRAGVSSFGFGGTNAHAILEEAPPQPELKEAAGWHILPLSAKTQGSLQGIVHNLLEFLMADKTPGYRMTDIAYTLQNGRKEFNHRCIVMCKDRENAVDVLANKDPVQMTFSQTTASSRPVAFMFPGQGVQYVGMGRDLYENEPLFKKEMDQCFEILLDQSDLDIKAVIYPDSGQTEDAARDIWQTVYTQPVLFAIEYATARLWMAYGVEPQCMIGHSIGEYTAACMAGVMSLEDALGLVTERGRLIQGLPGGAMLSVRLSEQEVRPFLAKGLSLAAVNTPNRCVLAGEIDIVNSVEKELKEIGKDCFILQTSHAFHSHMLEPVLHDFKQAVLKVHCKEPSIPYISNVTGDWIKAEQVLNPDYWVEHLKGTVQFSPGIRQILRKPDIALLEVGPGRVLRTLSVQNLDKAKDHVVVSSIPHLTSKHSDREYILASLGRLWLHGVKIDWEKLNSSAKRRRVPLPTYPFERRRHWISKGNKPILSSAKIPNLGDWFYLPTWKQTYHSHRFSDKIELPYAMKWLVFVDRMGFGQRIAKSLRDNDQQVVEVSMGSRFRKIENRWYQLNPGQSLQYEELVTELQAQGYIPQKIMHLWSLIGEEFWGLEYFYSLQEIGFYSLVNLIKAFENAEMKRLMQIQVVTDNMQEVQGNEQLSPGKATLLSLVNTLHLEYPHLYCQSADISISDPNSKEADDLIPRLIREIGLYDDDRIIAYRNEYRWVQAYEKRYWEPLSPNAIQLKQGGVYLITGGLGKIGLMVAEYLAKSAMAKIALLGRSPFPKKSDWQKCVELQTESEPVLAKIERLKQMERYGAQILVLEADVSNEHQMEAAVEQVEDHFGQINGIFHLAGEINETSFHKINTLTAEVCERLFKPKVNGAFVLENIFKAKQVSFIMMFSSLSCITGGVDYAAYAAGNHFLDCFAKLLDRFSPIRWITVNWDGWKTSDEQDLYFLMSREEGVEILHRILSQNFTTQLIISTIDLYNRLSRLKSKSVLLSTDREPTQNTSLPLTRAAEEETYVAPRNDIEHKVSLIWREFLNVEKISIHEDFFELGGDSLMAVRLTAKMEEVFPGAVTEKSILEESTVAGISLLIQDKLDLLQSNRDIEQLDQLDSLIELQKGDPAKDSIFLVHPGGGFVFNYIPLVRCLNEEQPVYAFQSPGIKDRSKLLPSIEDLAEFYLSEMILFQPKGPYLLGGASFGGLIAYEMATKLLEKGKEVGLLMLVDTPGPFSKKNENIPSDAEIAYLLFGGNLPLEKPTLESLGTEELIHHIVKTNSSIDSGFELSGDFVENCFEIARIHLKAMNSYHPRAISREILYFKHSKPLLEYSLHPERDWIDLAKDGVTVIKIPGDHYTMNLDPNVKLMATALTKKLG